MEKPLIGILCGPYVNKTNGMLYYGLMPSYTRAIAEAGGLPVMIPPNIPLEAIRAVFDRVDGLLLAGGGDVDPRHYGMRADGLVYGVDDYRDDAEIHLVQWAYQEDKPLLGICRGCQVSNVALGGTLYRDIAKEFPGYKGLRHDAPDNLPRSHITHTIQVKAQTRLADALGTAGDVPVNSLHHQALRDVAAPFVVSALAEDGVIEAVEIPSAKFFVGVQWHPEELVGHSDTMRHLFRAFVEAVAAEKNAV